jgi:hypothetical protein
VSLIVCAILIGKAWIAGVVFVVYLVAAIALALRRRHSRVTT